MTSITRNEVESLYFAAEGALSVGGELNARAVLESIADRLHKWLDFMPEEPTNEQVMKGIFAYDVAMADKPAHLGNRLLAMREAIKAAV